MYINYKVYTMGIDFKKFEATDRVKKILELEKLVRDFVCDSGLELGDALLIINVVWYDLLKANAEFSQKIFGGKK